MTEHRPKSWGRLCPPYESAKSKIGCNIFSERAGQVLVVLLVLAVAGATAFAESELAHPAWREHAIKAPGEGYPLQEIVSGLWFRTPETRAIQEDDFNNPGFLDVEQGEALWSKPEGAAGKSCASDIKACGCNSSLCFCRMAITVASRMEYDAASMLSIRLRY